MNQQTAQEAINENPHFFKAVIARATKLYQESGDMASAIKQAMNDTLAADDKLCNNSEAVEFCAADLFLSINAMSVIENRDRRTV